MNFRTDLAVEAAGFCSVSAEDITQEQREHHGISVTHIHIRTPRGEAALGKPRGQYITVTLPSLTDEERTLSRHAAVIGAELQRLIPRDGTVLVVGLGNRTVTPDALGPAVAEMVLATRHIQGEFARTAGLTDLRPVAVVAPGVLGQTGTESGELVRGVCREIRPAAVIVVDALAARSTQRLGRTIQLCDTGISPGSGVGNDRRPLNRGMLGVPVIGMGVPTVVDAATLARELTGQDTAPTDPPMMVTPREVDVMVSRAARLIALSLHTALQPAYSPTELVEVARGI